MRTNIVAGNWKMNNDSVATKSLITDLKEVLETSNINDTRVLVAPTFVHLESAVNATESSLIQVVAQNMHQANNGAFTGEISGEMLKSIGVKTVILGHSERRAYFGETNAILKEKVDSALAQELEIIFCFGEELSDRKNEQHFTLVEQQLSEALFHLSEKAFKNVILAYEPVWAIGTGETASPAQAQEMHAFIRSLLAKKYNNQLANSISILYGGSVKPANAAELFSNPDVDGGLIGGAALKASDFKAIITSF